VVFALDDSSNIQADEWTAMLNLIGGYVDQFTVGPGNVRIAVVRYSNTADIVFDLNEYRYHHVASPFGCQHNTDTVAAERRRLLHGVCRTARLLQARRSAIDRYLLSAGRSASNPPHAAAAVDRRGRRTDGHPTVT